MVYEFSYESKFNKNIFFILIINLNLHFILRAIFFQSGLIQESKYSKITLKDAEEMLLNFLKKYIPPQTCPLAGNTIYMDRLFLLKFMPLVNDYLHYRIIDVSTIKELVRYLHLYCLYLYIFQYMKCMYLFLKFYFRRWNLNKSECIPKKCLHHRALPDIKESIEELKYYKKNIFMSSI